jgi:Lrp/AsnC family transcriptional regulator for asnA, asnC and gidA
LEFRVLRLVISVNSFSTYKGNNLFENNKEKLQNLWLFGIFALILQAIKVNRTMAHKLDALDRKILELVIADARVPFLEVARACNVSGAAIHQRIQKLTTLGILKGSQFNIDPEKIGYETCAYIGLFLKDPERFDEVVEELRKIPEVVECHYTTGGFDMFIKIYAYNNHHLLNVIHDKLQPLGLSRSETIISFNEAIHRPIAIIEPEDDEEEEE